VYGKQETAEAWLLAGILGHVFGRFHLQQNKTVILKSSRVNLNWILIKVCNMAIRPLKPLLDWMIWIARLQEAANRGRNF
jgi:hypothetical protein